MLTNLISTNFQSEKPLESNQDSKEIKQSFKKITFFYNEKKKIGSMAVNEFKFAYIVHKI